ncbi:mammalian ependymin-related protein 1-like [Corticium candelabrum]|uniref:mammalian ependymin-related protein 1-like n=1 Tax=Corticium candelabrum TaxID=121492 RepID=UPI002E25F7B3|nr:mammalian ependymin-related protein 1-like [Corticium candelabrum]
MLLLQPFTTELDYSRMQGTAFPWRPYEIPENAHFIGEFTLGGNLLVTEWSDAIPGIRHETWNGQFTMNGCIRVHEVITNGNISQSNTTTFYNFFGGIANFDIFVPLPECQQAEMGV